MTDNEDDIDIAINNAVRQMATILKLFQEDELSECIASSNRKVYNAYIDSGFNSDQSMALLLNMGLGRM